MTADASDREALRSADIEAVGAAAEAAFRWGLPHAVEDEQQLEDETRKAVHDLLKRLSEYRRALALNSREDER